MLPKLKPYRKKLNYAYSLGVEPTLDLCRFKKNALVKVIFRDGADEDKPGWKEIMHHCVLNSIPFEFNEKAINKISYINETSVIGIFSKYEPDLEPSSNHIVLVNPMNMGNIGTVMRSMAAFSYLDLAIIRPGVDIFDPKAIRSSMGAFFQIRFQYFESFEDYMDRFSSHALYPFMLQNAADMRSVELKAPYSLIFGNESHGLDPALANVGKALFIPHSIDVESLNMSIAASIAMFWSQTQTTDQVL